MNAISCAFNAIMASIRFPGCGVEIDQIRNNDPAITGFGLGIEHEKRFSDKAWELLGRYIAKNTHLTDPYWSSLFRGNHADSKMSILFENLTGSSSLVKLDLFYSRFGLSGVQSMVPFLKNCPKLAILIFNSNRNIDKDCFRVIVEALDTGLQLC